MPRSKIGAVAIFIAGSIYASRHPKGKHMIDDH